jgi:hypothetical protein
MTETDSHLSALFSSLVGLNPISSDAGTCGLNCFWCAGAGNAPNLGRSASHSPFPVPRLFSPSLSNTRHSLPFLYTIPAHSHPRECLISFLLLPPLPAAIRLESSHDVEAVRAPDGNHQALCQLPRNRGLAETNGPVWRPAFNWYGPISPLLFSAERNSWPRQSRTAED